MRDEPARSDSEVLDLASQRRAVRERYARIATAGAADCCGPSDGCCPDGSGAAADDPSTTLGYSDDELDSVADGANLGLGCGNPTAIVSLEEGDTVADLGSGGGFDCFLAARAVGPSGQVIGVDMTPAMIDRARSNAARHEHPNVSFRLGEIEHLPVADETVDVIISNCVINLSPEKQQVLTEAARVLRPGGRLAIADVVRTAPFPSTVELDADSLTSCVAGASSITEFEHMLTEAGFVDTEIEPKEASATFIREWDDERDLSDYLVSAIILGRKPIA